VYDQNTKNKETQMKPVVKTNIVLILTALFIAGCSSTPQPQEKPGNSADSQRSHAKQAQDELSRETSR
ncbi:MAG: hypothetical protein DRQ44_11780, partial [Gammaproteobacteria bacterium]